MLPILNSCKSLKNRDVGGIAQLEEHLLCKQGVTGSSPVTSTKTKKSRGEPRASRLPIDCTGWLHGGLAMGETFGRYG